MDENARLQLQKMIKANDVEDQTHLIRDLQHSALIEQDVEALAAIVRELKDVEPAEERASQINARGVAECAFLFTFYTDIYNKVRKEELDLAILAKFLGVLRRIEEGEMDQHEGSFLVGTLLKELYVDSALKKAEKLEREQRAREEMEAGGGQERDVEPLAISYEQFKRLRDKKC